MRAVPLTPLVGTSLEARLKWCIDHISAISRASYVADAVTGERQETWLGAGAMTPRASSGAAAATFDSGSNDLTLPVLDFDAASQEYAHAVWAPPKRWKGDTVSFIPYWTNGAGLAAETVKWTLAGVAVSNDDSMNPSFGSAQTVTDTFIAQNDLHIGPESSAITIGGSPGEADLVVLQVSRDVSDTMTGDARLIGIKLIWTANARADG